MTSQLHHTHIGTKQCVWGYPTDPWSDPSKHISGWFVAGLDPSCGYNKTESGCMNILPECTDCKDTVGIQMLCNRLLEISLQI